MATPAYISPYRAFCREQRPLLPSGMKNSDREKALGQMWRELTNAGRATYHRGLKQEPSFGRGGLRVWAPVSLARLPTPTSGAVTVTFLAPGCAPVVSIAASVNGLACDSVSAERTAKTSPPSPDPEDQPAAKRRACPVDQAGSPYPENQQRRAYQEAQSKAQVRVRAASLYDHGSHQAALALLQHARSVPPGCRRAEPPAYPAPHPPLPPAVAQAVLKAEAKAEAEGEAEAEARGQAEAEAIERGGQGEGGHSEGELDRILQEQLARLRSSWSHAS